MRLVQLTLAVMTLISASVVFAHEGHGPCASYEATCKSDPSVTGATDKKAKWKAMHSCVAAAAAADTANGQKCTAAMAKHEHHHEMENGSAPTGAPTGGSAPSGAAPSAQ